MRFSNRLTRILFGAVCLISAAVVPLSAAYEAVVIVTENGTAAHTQTPMGFLFNTTNLVSGGYITSTGLDVRLKKGATELPLLLASDRIMFADSITQGGTNSYTFSTGNTAATSMPIITGVGGYVTIADAAALELGNNFELEASGYIDATVGADKNILFKDGAIQFYVSGANTLTAVMSGTPGPVSQTMKDLGVGDQFTNGYAPYRNMCVDSNGRLYVVYTYDDTTLNYVRIDYSDNNGATWANLTSWSGSSLHNSFGNASMAIDSNDRIVVAYSVFDEGSYEGVYYRHSGTWGNEYTIALTGADWVSIAFNSNDTLHIVYVTDGSPNNPTDENIAFKTGVWDVFNYSLTGVTWLTDDANRNIEVQIAIDGDDDIHVVWADREFSNTKILYREYTSSWQAPVTLSVTADDADNTVPSIIVDASDNVHVVWSAGYSDNSPTFYIGYKVKASGGAWGSVEYVCSDSNGPSSITIDQSGLVTVVLEKDSDDELYYSSRVGGNWTSPESIGSTQYLMGGLGAYHPIIGGVHTNYPNTTYMVWYAPDTDNVGYISYLGAGAVTVSSAVTSAEHIVKAVANGTTFKLYIDGVEKDSENLNGASVTNNANNYILGDNEVMPYMDYFKMTIGGVLTVWYQPNTIISGTTLPDRQGTAQNGTITWGGNQTGVAVSMGSLHSTGAITPPLGTDDQTTSGILHGVGGIVDNTSGTSGSFVDSIITPFVSASNGSLSTETFWWGAYLVCLVLAFGVVIAKFQHLFLAFGAASMVSVAFCIGFNTIPDVMLYLMVALTIGFTMLEARQTV